MRAPRLRGFLAAFILTGVVCGSCLAQERPKVVILGFDGADAELVQNWMDQGELPNLAQLRKDGVFAPLQPTNPPQTPVSWSTFATGLDPGGTEIFDFLKRDPSDYLPDFAMMSEPTPGGPNAYPAAGPVVITEIMYHPAGSADAEYVELRNISDVDVTFYDFVRDAPWRLADAPDNPGLAFLFPADEPATLAPGQYLLLVQDKLLSDVRYSVAESVPVFEWGAGRLSNAGETVHLGRPGDLDAEGVRHWIPVDRVTFSDGAHGEDFADGIDPWPVEADGFGSSLTRTAPDRYGNDPNNWQADIPSPGVTKRLPGR